MTWIDEYTQATFDGINVYYDSISDEYGRRVQIFESPSTDGADSGDLRRLPRRFTFSGFVAGDDYLVDVERLRNAIERKGPHTFRHPYFGSYNVVIDGYVSFSHERTNNGVSRFSLPMVEIDEGRRFTEVRPSSVEVSKSSVTLQKKTFSKKFKKPKSPFLSGIRSAINDASSKVRKVNGQIAGALGTIDQISTEITQFETSVTRLLNTPSAFAASFAGLVASLFSLLKTGVNAVEGLPGLILSPPKNFAQLCVRMVDNLMTFDASQYTSVKKNGESSEEYNVQTQSLSQLDALFKVSVLSESAVFLLGPDSDFESANQAEQARDGWVSYADAMLYESNIDGDTFSTLSAMRGSVYRRLTELAARLPRVYTYEPPRRKTSMVLAYELYGDARRRTEIINRNKIFNPFYIPAGQELEVLAYDPV